MNPITNAKNQNILNLRELKMGHTDTVSSWHRQYKDSAWIFVGGLDFELTEGDIICVFSQYGEVVNINLVRDKKTGRSKGYAFICYEDQRSTVLATDNLNAIKLAGRIIRVDHVEKYRVPKDETSASDKQDETTSNQPSDSNSDIVTSFVRQHGCGPDQINKLKELQSRVDSNKNTVTVSKSGSNHHSDRPHRLPSPPYRHKRDNDLSPPHNEIKNESSRNISRIKISESHIESPPPSPPRRIKCEPNSSPTYKVRKIESSHGRKESKSKYVDDSPPPSPPRRHKRKIDNSPQKRRDFHSRSRDSRSPPPRRPKYS